MKVLARHLEVAVFLFVFHRAFAVVVDDTILSLGIIGHQHLADDFGHGGGFRFHGPGKGVTAQGAETHAAHFGGFIGPQREALVIDTDQGAIALNHRPFGGEVEVGHGDLFQVDILPDVELSPIGKGKTRMDSPLSISPL